MPCPRHSAEFAEQGRWTGPPWTEFRFVRTPRAAASWAPVFGPFVASTLRICTARGGRSSGHPQRAAYRR